MSWARKCDRCGKFFDGRFNTSVELTTYDNIHTEEERRRLSGLDKDEEASDGGNT